MIAYSKEEATNASYFKRYNMLRNEEPNKSKVRSRWIQLQKIVHPDIGGDADECQCVNAGKDVLLNKDKRQEYIAALVHWNLDDGLVLDPNFDKKLQQRLDIAQGEPTDAPVPYDPDLAAESNESPISSPIQQEPYQFIARYPGRS